MNDKLAHALSGALAACFGAAVYVLLGLLLLALGYVIPPKGAIPVPFIAALVAGLTKEAADYLDNRTYASDLHHDVDPWDVVASAAPGAAISLFLCAAITSLR